MMINNSNFPVQLQVKHASRAMFWLPGAKTLDRKKYLALGPTPRMKEVWLTVKPASALALLQHRIQPL